MNPKTKPETADGQAAVDVGEQDEPTLTAAGFVASPAHAVGVAGLLADEPDLREAELTRSQWQRKLDTYLKSPRP